MKPAVDTLTGLMRAFHFLTQSKRRVPKPKFTYEPAGSVVHAAKRLSKQQRVEVTAIVSELESLDPTASSDSERIKELITELSKRPVKFVPVKLETRIDLSKTYPYRSKKRGG
jgi:hypothetical protein